jgi:hypothetical protein
VKFSIAVNMERSTPDQDMREVARNALELVRLADTGGFEIAWAAEHQQPPRSSSPPIGTPSALPARLRYSICSVVVAWSSASAAVRSGMKSIAWPEASSSKKVANVCANCCQRCWRCGGAMPSITAPIGITRPPPRCLNLCKIHTRRFGWRRVIRPPLPGRSAWVPTLWRHHWPGHTLR